MAESSRRLRKSTSTGIAATSAIALALGGLSVVAPGPLAPEAAAATLSGGIREKSGAVEKDAQKASDLPAGSCVVSDTTPDGSQAGFSWNTLEPSATSPDKKAWGLSVSFDNSKDRTFADWGFTNSGLMGAYLDTGQVQSMNVGQTFLGNNVTHKADEALIINGTRQQRNLNLFAELTNAEVKQFAEATAANPVRYAWQGNYTKENPGGPRATRGGDSVSFTAVVNPWPSENIECNPITVSWDTPDVSENHVIVPGEVSKVGKINVPAVTSGGTDDSMSRMVVEAYDGNGKFIGTTDPAASGGEQLLRIDSKTGDIYFTWPEYRGTDLATDKNVNFSVLAKPRNVDQLQAAGENNNEFGTTQVFDSSNSLTRYNKANVIGSQAFSLDNTDEHNPRYDKVDATIISGVDSATGPLATEPQRVTFTQTPDLIKELAKKKGDGGFEAKVALDKTYVYDGWTVEMDENYNVTVTAPENPKPGTFAQPKITLEYSNGSTDVLQLLVVVDPNNTQVTDLVRPGLTKGKIGEDLTAQVGTKSIMKGHKPVHPAKFEVDPDTVPSGWTVTVDATGKVTAKADDSVAPGTVITPKVKATYPDQTTDEIETQFQAIVDIKIPEYDTVTNKPNAKVSLIPNVPERGLSGNTSDEAPKRYTFENGQTTNTLTSKEGKTWTVKIDEKTGKITTTIPKDAPEGDILDVPVLAHYDNADKPQKVKGTVVVIKGDVAPQYNVQVTGPNQAVDHQVTGAPQDSTYSFGNDEDGNPVTEQEVDGWKYKIDPKTGVVSSTPPATAKPGDKKTITVTVQTPDGSRPEVPVTTVVKHTNSWEAEPVYPVETVYPGEAATLPVDLQKPEDVNVAKENPYKLGDVPAGWNVSIDDNGRITATAPADAKPGTQVKIPVTVTYEDGSTDIAYAVVNVLGLPEREEPFEVEYKFDESLPAGEYKVETKGEPGAAKMHKDGTWERTKAPKNEVVVIGTKPAESAKDIEWKFPIPYPTEVRENPELKPGEMKTVQEGENGEKTYTAKFTSKGSEAQVAEEETTKEAKPRIIEVGPGIPDQELTSKKTQEVPFEIEYVYDDTLESGKQVVDEEGVPGEQTITSTQKIKDGKPDGEPSINIEQTKAPKKAKIRIGTKTAGETKKTVESEVPFGVKIEYDPNMPAGTSEVVTEGKPGKKTTTVTQKVTNSQPDGEATVEEKVTEQPVDQVIKVGTKPSETSEKVEWKAPVPFEVETRPNKDLKPGEIKVVQKGEPGEKTYTANFTSKGDDSSVKPEEKQTKDPVKEIIEYGPTTPDQTLTSTKTREVNYETEFIVDNTVPVGQTKVEQEGEKGEELITSTQKIKDGKPDGEPNITVEQTKAPKKKIVRVGSMTNGTYELEEKLPIPFDTVVEYDPEIPAGEYKIVTKGQPGEKTTKITQTIENSKVVDAKRGETTNSEPVTEVIKVGTKQATASDKVEWKEPIPYPTELRPNLNLAPGEVRVVQQGKDGEATFTATFTGTNGEAAKTEETARTEPTPRIVEFGPGLEDDSVVSKTTRLVEFETEIVEDPNLEEGKQVIEQGEFGEEVVTSTQKLVDGKPSGEPVVKTERTKEPKKAIIRVGTKKPANPTPPTDEPEQPTPPTDEPGPSIDPKEVELPYTTKIIYDETLEPGQEIVDQEGANGKVEVTVEKGQPSVKVVKEPVEKIIRVGTKPPADIEWNERIPFEVKVKLDPTIEAGKHKVEQEGKPGLVHHKSDGTEETLVEKQDHVILIGTKKPSEDPENPDQPEQPTPGGDLEIKVRYTTRIVYDPSLKPGEEVEDVAGKDGRYTIKVVDGSPVAEMVEKPVERVVRVGTKPPAGTSWTEEVAYDYEVVEDPNLESGKHEVVQPGKPGQRIHKEDGSVVEVAPQKLIIKVGTKKNPTDPSEPSNPNEPSTPAEPGANASSEKAKRCAANAFAVNSPLLWLLPIGLLAGIGYGVNEAFGPQLQQAGAELNARFQESMPKHDWGHGQQGRRHEDPEWVRELRAKADAVNRQFAGYGEQLRPLGIALGAIAAVSMLGVLIAQACEEDGFNNGLTILGSSKGDTPADKAKAGSSEQK
ncbi:cell surface protein [Corynebacterium sp. HMSC08D02]|uniref:G5 domain-containing protein n=1 Tax=Corynebacterium sp. HMSC08D02 TaxID=1581138 RepID=UPI0008A63125|nr:G5 domain-containing protein [Corynebacterium sp. HMSC08D02]OFT30958.1 cell surface protein [Corynebacterium sp. HMSC08D02]